MSTTTGRRRQTLTVQMFSEPALPGCATTADLAALQVRLEAGGIELIVGTIVDMAGVIRAKSVPAERVESFHRRGLGASPTFNAFCVDGAGIAFTPAIGVTGDLRLRLEPGSLAAIGDQIAWGPVEFFDQQGRPDPGCARGRLRTVVAEAQIAGVDVLVGSELEFVLTDLTGERLTAGTWLPYGAAPLLACSAFHTDLLRTFTAAGLPVEQVHAEYGTDQFEISLPPAPPLRAADQVVLARVLLGRVAGRHGFGISFSPLPFVGAAGNGAHLHISFVSDGQPLLSGGSGPHGLQPAGASALGGIVTGLPEFIAVLAGSPLSGSRLGPGTWAGAYACWGLENREAAVRLCGATPGDPSGTNIEVKCIDPTANPYLAVATVLGLALRGIELAAALPDEVAVNPSSIPGDPVPRLSHDPAEAAELLANSALAQQILGGRIVESLLAVRRWELAAYAETPLEDMTVALRRVWSA
ncbi:glutamine synthetase [Nakamurella sp. UYEF19]|uniref:glutamine synthetase family protein n=1 Tax=Nakamurella sp. UYEF19 TaxID=1756392 RepID=UPI003391F0D1